MYSVVIANVLSLDRVAMIKIRYSLRKRLKMLELNYRAFWAFGAAFMIGVLANTADAASITVKHAQGEVVLADTPKKVLVFDLASLDNLNRLGIKVAGVPDSKVLPDYLKQFESSEYTKIGTVFEPDYEVVNAADPDLIIVAGRSSGKYVELSKIAPTIDLTVKPDNYIGGIKDNIEKLGVIFGKQAEARSENEKLDSSIAALKQKSAAVGNGLMILTNGGKMSAFGPGSRFGVIYGVYGIKPADANISVGTHGQPISPEFLLKINPDWLFVIDRDAAIGREGNSAKQVLDNDLVPQMTVWKNDQIVYLDARDWYLIGGGLSALQNTIDQLSQAFGKAH